MAGSTPPAYIDFHCHLDLYPNHAEAIAEADAARVFTLAVTTTPAAWDRNFQLTRGTKYVRAALGLHPQLVAERAHEIDAWDKLLPYARYVGEVGLDAGPQHYASFDLQKRVFERVLTRCANLGGKILTVHSVRSAKVVTDMIERHLPPARGTVVLHWFTGTKSEARRAADLGCYFSVNSTMMEKDKHRDMIASLPPDRLLTETDGPFTMVDGRSSKPIDVTMTVLQLAAVRSVNPATMAVILLDNFRTLLSNEEK